MKRNKSWLIVIGSFLILGGAGLIGYDYYSNKLMDNEENKAIEEFIGYMDEAKDLKNKINAEIDKLRDKFNELKVKHF